MPWQCTRFRIDDGVRLEGILLPFLVEFVTFMACVSVRGECICCLSKHAYVDGTSNFLDLMCAGIICNINEID